MKFFNILGCTLVAGSMLMTSCLGGKEQEHKNTDTFGECFSYSVNKSTGTTSTPTENAMAVTYNFTQATVDVTVASLDVNGTKLPSPSFPELKMKENNTGWMIAEAQAIRPEVTGFAEASVPLFSNIRLGCTNRTGEYNGSLIYGYDCVLRLESDNDIFFVSRVDTWATGTTNVVNADDHSAFTTTSSIYLVRVDPKKMTAKITIYKPVFAPAMENLNLVIEFRDVPFTVDGMGCVTMRQIDQFVPYAGDVPYPNFPISNLNCYWDMFKGINISFVCNAMGQTYNVNANMPFVTVNN